MIFTKPLWLFGVAMSLESMRRGFIGGSMLSLFIIKEFGLDKQAIPTLNALRGYLDIEAGFLAQIPPFLSFLASPFIDYHESAELYFQILELLAEAQRPPTCQFYWERGEI